MNGACCTHCLNLLPGVTARPLHLFPPVRPPAHRHGSASWLESTSRDKPRLLPGNNAQDAAEHPHNSAARVRDGSSIDAGKVHSELQINQLCDLESRVADLKFSAGRDGPRTLVHHRLQGPDGS